MHRLLPPPSFCPRRPAVSASVLLVYAAPGPHPDVGMGGKCWTHYFVAVYKSLLLQRCVSDLCPPTVVSMSSTPTVVNIVFRQGGNSCHWLFLNSKTDSFSYDLKNAFSPTTAVYPYHMLTGASGSDSHLTIVIGVALASSSATWCIRVDRSWISSFLLANVCLRWVTSLSRWLMACWRETVFSSLDCNCWLSLFSCLSLASASCWRVWLSCVAWPSLVVSWPISMSFVCKTVHCFVLLHVSRFSCSCVSFAVICCSFSAIICWFACSCSSFSVSIWCRFWCELSWYLGVLLRESSVWQSVGKMVVQHLCFWCSDEQLAV